MSVRETIERKLTAALAPQSLQVIDDSAKHAGHLLHPGGVEDRGETHFTVKVTAQAFSGKRLVERHRLVNSALAEELAGPVHALAIEARAPGE
jgi:BolA protein